MENLKIITHTVYTYETTDGRQFDNEAKAREWQEYLDLYDGIYMLDYQLSPTKDIELAYYVRIDTYEQAKAFNMVQHNLCYTISVPYPGYFRYDEVSGDFVDLKSEINEKQSFIDALDNGGF